MTTDTRTGKDLREMREAAGLTQAQVAERVGVRRETIVDWERRAVVRDFMVTQYERVIERKGDAA